LLIEYFLEFVICNLEFNKTGMSGLDNKI